MFTLGLFTIISEKEETIKKERSSDDLGSTVTSGFDFPS